MKTLLAIIMLGLGGTGSEDVCTEGTCTKQAPSLVSTSTTTAEHAHHDDHHQASHPLPTWHMHDSHPCNIDIISPDDFARSFPQGFPTYYDTPVIVRIPDTNKAMRHATQKESIASFFPGDGVVQLPKANLYSFATENITLQDFINLPETIAWDRSGEQPYMLTKQNKDFGSYALPPLDRDVVVMDRRLGMGPLGSGAQWHNHGPGFCEALQGRKHWLLFDGDAVPKYEREYVSRHWFEYLFTKFKHKPENHLWECTIHPGDAIYFPNKFWHTTLNLDLYTVFVTTFFDISKKKTQ